MIRIAKVIAVLISLLGVLFLVGPKVEVDTTIQEIELPVDLDTYLQINEAKYPDIRPKTEKRIVWANPKTKAKTPLSFVYLHGFSASRQETAPLSEDLAAKYGANLFETRLRGHGRTGDALGEVQVNDWLNDAYEALEIGKAIGEEVVIIGVSTGATLGIWLSATQEVDDIRAFVHISPNFAPKDPRASLLLMPWGEAIAKAILGSHQEWHPRVPDHGKYWTTRYPVAVLLEMMGLVAEVNTLDLSQIKRPSLFIYCPNDGVISAPTIEMRYPLVGSEKKELIAVTDAQDDKCHVLAGRILSPDQTAPMVQRISTFIESAGPALPPRVQPAATPETLAMPPE